MCDIWRCRTHILVLVLPFFNFPRTSLTTGLCRQEVLGFIVWALQCTPGLKNLSLDIPLSSPGYQWAGSFREGIFHPQQNLQLKSISLHISSLRQCFLPKNGSAMINCPPQMAIHQRNSWVWWVSARLLVCLFVCAVGARGWVTPIVLLQAGQQSSCCDQRRLGMHGAPASFSCATNTGAVCFLTEIPF